MPLPPHSRPYYAKNRVDHAVDALQGQALSDTHLGYIETVIQVETALDVYRAAAKGMSIDELEDEPHQSARLARHLALAGDPKPHRKCHAHAIVSGTHKHAARLRVILAAAGLRIDEPENGCWLPGNSATVSEMPPRLRHAIPHSRIHRKNYYRWLREAIRRQSAGNRIELIARLKQIERDLQAGQPPRYVMQPAHHKDTA